MLTTLATQSLGFSAGSGLRAAQGTRAGSLVCVQTTSSGANAARSERRPQEAVTH